SQERFQRLEVFLAVGVAALPSCPRLAPDFTSTKKRTPPRRRAAFVYGTCCPCGRLGLAYGALSATTMLPLTIGNPGNGSRQPRSPARPSVRRHSRPSRLATPSPARRREPISSWLLLGCSASPYRRNNLTTSEPPASMPSRERDRAAPGA